MAKSVNYDRVAPTYDRRYTENRYPGIERMLDEFVPPGQTVLEVGCGTAPFDCSPTSACTRHSAPPAEA